MVGAAPTAPNTAVDARRTTQNREASEGEGVCIGGRCVNAAGFSCVAWGCVKWVITVVLRGMRRAGGLLLCCASLVVHAQGRAGGIRLPLRTCMSTHDTRQSD